MNLKIWAIALFWLCSGGCGSGVLSDSPTAVTRKFVEKLEAKNVEEAKKLCTLRAAKFLDSVLKMGVKINVSHLKKDVELMESIDGDKAFVSVKKPAISEQAQPLPLVKMAGEWKIDFGMHE